MPGLRQSFPRPSKQGWLRWLRSGRAPTHSYVAAMSRFSHYPDQPQSGECSNAYTILCNAHDASSSFLDTFEAVRSARNRRGAPTDEEQDLLRACLVFASAGLDSMSKQLVRDALPAVLDRHDGAHAMLKQHVQRHILREMTDESLSVLADVLVDPQPRKRLIGRMVFDLTAGSLQSSEEVMRVGSYFDVPSHELVADPRELQKIFNVRNQIVHEMDVDYGQVNRNRRPRTKASMTSYTNEIFAVAYRFLAQVDKRCAD